jgi:hypothetical protein
MSHLDNQELELLRQTLQAHFATADTLAAARVALDNTVNEAPDDWDVLKATGSCGLMVSHHRQGLGLGIAEAMFLGEQAGRHLAAAPLVGTLSATWLLDQCDDQLTAPASAGEVRVSLVSVRPPSSHRRIWDRDPLRGAARIPLASLTSARRPTLSGVFGNLLDSHKADYLIVVADRDGEPTAVMVEADQPGFQREVVRRFDSTRPLSTITLHDAEARVLPLGADQLAQAWSISQGLLAAECFGAADRLLGMCVGHAMERYTFGRPIGSYPAVNTSWQNCCAWSPTPAQCAIGLAHWTVRQTLSFGSLQQDSAQQLEGHWTSRRERRSRCTVGWAPPGSTTPPCSSAVPS